MTNSIHYHKITEADFFARAVIAESKRRDRIVKVKCSTKADAESLREALLELSCNHNNNDTGYSFDMWGDDFSTDTWACEIYYADLVPSEIGESKPGLYK